MLLYLIQTTLLLFLTLGLYKLFLESTKIHVFKRYYLLFALLAVFLLPLIKIPSTGMVTATNTTLAQLNEVIIGAQLEPTTTVSTSITLQDILLFLYLSGAVFMLIRFVLAFLRFHHLQQQGTLVYDRGQRFVLVAQLEMPFTFRQTIYLPLHLPIDWTNKIILHEYNHVKQRHSVDIVFIEVLKILFWFQPLLYWYQQNMALNHEFLADDTLNTSKEETQAYLQLLLTQTFLQQEQPLSSSFNFNLTKKRLIMLTKTNKPIQNTLAVLSTVFLFTIMGATTVFAQDKPKSGDIPPKSTQTEDPNEVHIAVSEPANYPGGMRAFNQDFIHNFKVPQIEGESVRIILMFIVEKDGSLNEVQIVKDPGFGVGEAALAALAKTKRWIPAQDNGKVVRSQFTLPITIAITPPSNNS